MTTDDGPAQRCGKWDDVTGNRADQYRNNLALK